MTYKQAFIVLAITLLSGSPAMAGRVDFGDAVGYGAASHKNPTWQRLGENVSREKNQKSVDNHDDGVSWSVNGGAFGFGDIYQGDSVTFRFDFRRAAFGMHSSDTLAAWIDWNQDYFFDDQTEEIVHDVWLKNSVEYGNTVYRDKAWRKYVKKHGVAPNPDAVLQKFVDVTIDIAPNAMVGDFWLRARVACNTSQIANNPYNLDPYRHASQGEAEDYLIRILDRPQGDIGTLVPAPAATGAGLLGMVGLIARRRR